MEDFCTNLSQNGYEMDDAARVRSSSFEAGRNMHISPTFGSQEHIDQVRRTRETIAKTSFRRPRDGGKAGATSTMGAKFENLGKTSYSQGRASTTRSTERASVDQFESSILGRKGKERAGQIPVSSGLGREECGRRSGGGRTKANVPPKRIRRCVLSDATDGGSSDELNLTSSSQPTETPARPVMKTLPPGSDSDDYEWETGINIDDKTRQMTRSTLRKPNPRPSKSSKSRLRGDENCFSDETPEKKKPKIKPRPAYRKRATESNTGRSGRGRDTDSSSEASNLSGQDLMLTRRAGSKPQHSESSRGPIQVLLDEKGKEENTPRPKKSVGRKHAKDLAPFPMAKQRDAKGKIKSMPKDRENCLTPFPLSKDTNLSRITAQDSACNTTEMVEDTDTGSDSSRSDDDPLLMDSNDAILLRGGLAPFPMSSQDRPSNSQKTLGSSNRTNVLTDESTLRRESNARRDISDITDLSFTQLDNLSDPKTLCPYCDMPFPPNPSPLLLDMLNRIPKYPDPRPSNPLGLRAPLLSYVSMCQRHEFEMQLLPTAQAAGWPTRIDFAVLPDRVRALRHRLARVTREKEKNIFWRELKEDIDKQGVKKTMGLINQFNSFENCQPGYYGEQGAVLIFQTLNHLFPPGYIDTDLLAPLTHRDFLRCILVPECAVELIQEDLGRGTNREYAIRTLRESSKYGTAMFPDLDIRDGMSLTMGGDGDHRAGETLIKEPPRVKCLQPVEEKRAGELANDLGGRDAIPSRCPNPGNNLQRDRGDAKEPRRRAAVGKPKEKSKRDKKGDVGLIELSDSSPVRTRASSRKHLRKDRGKETDLSDSSARSKTFEVSSKQHQISGRAGRDATAKPQANPATHSKNDLLATLMNSDALLSDSDEETPRPPDRFRRYPPESDSGIVLPEETNRYERPPRRNGVSSSSTTKINASFQPLQVVKDRKKSKEVVFRKTMWENDEESETDDSSDFSSRSDDKISARPECEKKSLRKMSSHSWLWSDPSTPSTTQSN